MLDYVSRDEYDSLCTSWHVAAKALESQMTKYENLAECRQKELDQYNRLFEKMLLEFGRVQVPAERTDVSTMTEEVLAEES